MKYIYDISDNQFECFENTDIASFDMENNFCKLSVRYKGHPRFQLTEKCKEEMSALKNPRKNSKRMTPAQPTQNLNVEVEDEEQYNSEITHEMITDAKMLNAAIKKMHASLSESDYYLKELH